MTEKRIASFDEFWPFYLKEHSKPATRWFHFAGTTIGSLTAIYAVATLQVGLLPVAVVLGYGPAWFSHFFIEGNRPASWKYPVWSFMADYKLWLSMIWR